MKTENIKSFWKPSFIFLLISLFCASVFAEIDPNPDSPVPVLLSSQTDATRVLAVSGNNTKAKMPRSTENVFYPGEGSVITLYVSNLTLMPGEGANAFRVYLGNQNGQIYEMQTLDIKAVSRSIYALRVRLYETANYREQPPANGDALIYLTWRGLASNVLKIGLGSTNGNIKIPELPKLVESNSETESANIVGYLHSGDRLRFMEQATFGATTVLDQRIRRIGLRTWLAEQFEAQYPSVTNPYPNIPLMPTTIPTNCTEAAGGLCYRTHYTQIPLQQWFFKEAFYGNPQLRHRVTWALSQVLVASGVQIQQSSHMITYHKVLSDNAFGNYRKLLKDITLNPAMGDYLDTVRSTKNNPNENYPREILQLFSIGLFKLNQDGTLIRDNQGNPIPTYTQDDINNFSKVFTGWNYCNQGCPNSSPGLINYKDPLIMNGANHDTTEKTLLNYPGAPNSTIPACIDCNADQTKLYAEQSLEQTLDNIYNHPNVAPFISKLLIQQLVMSDPSPAYVERISAVFNQNRTNPTQMKEVVKAILLDVEARGNIKTAPRYGKLREPVLMATTLARHYPATNFFVNGPSDGMLSFYTARMGQNPFYSPTVFNYYSPDYIIPGTNILAPEFELMNTGLGINRINFVYTMVFNGIQPNATDTLQGTSLVLDEAVNIAAADPSGVQLMDYLNNKMMHGTLTTTQRTAILNAVLTIPETGIVPRAKTAIYLIAASSQYQVQR
ncbi:MAG TPA: DUF1800 domain-containing protein [Pyrinomonadaceae bacterium]|nr:DUF1800 domain-containing protein [Pyrinomonadaceae bacterium]